MTCAVKDGLFVEPCETLAAATAGGNGYRGAGIVCVSLSNISTGSPTRTFYSVRSGEHRSKGIVLNCCPFCGERIDAPVLDDESDAA